MDHSQMDHSKMDHSQMDHSKMDHSMMNHSKMDSNAVVDHSKMDHSSNSALNDDHSVHSVSGSSPGHGMKMYFHGGFTEVILFSFWQIDSIAGLIGSMVGIFLLTVLYEGLKVYREYLLHKTLTSGTIISKRNYPASARDLPRLRTGSGREDQGPQGNGATLVDSAEDGNCCENPDSCRGKSSEDVVVVKNVLRPHPLSLPHFVQTLLHVIQLVISYFLMLIFMTYNVWLCVAVALGAGTGYFAFGWRKKGSFSRKSHFC